MSFWLREIAGWILVILSLWIFYVCYGLLRDHYVFEAGPLSVIGIVVFRGGIHLLKVAVAARVCMHAQAELNRPAQPPARRSSGTAPWQE